MGSAQRRVAVIGGGIAGLAAAHALLAGEHVSGDDAPFVTLFESEDRLGGKLLTSPFAGHPAIDEGPDAFLARLAKTEAFPRGPVISAKAKQTITQYIETGKAEGRLITGGTEPGGDGYFVEPTVIADVDRKARIFQEEIFGPVLAVTKARDFDHGLELVNDSDYGLTGAAYTRNPAKLEKARRHFHVGNLYLNRKCTGAMVGAHPFGGFNMSGTDSKAGGPDYLLQFLQAKSIAEKIG